MTQARAINILLVEDNPSDVRLTQEALKEAGVMHRLELASDGGEALDFLHKRNKYRDAPSPDMILLDLNLPKIDGREVLTEIKRDTTLRRIPVIVLTTSSAEADIQSAYDLHVNCYITKPVDMDHFVAIMKAIDAFWFKVVSLPSQSNNRQY